MVLLQMYCKLTLTGKSGASVHTQTQNFYANNLVPFFAAVAVMLAASQARVYFGNLGTVVNPNCLEPRLP